jgi:phosphatidate phosphatase PAH1
MRFFPNTKNPIYCGFGNRETDSAAYLKINISPDKIYCITEKSVISRESDKEFNSSYKDILANINEFFPEYFKDVAMVDSSSDESVEHYHAVEPIQ